MFEEISNSELDTLISEWVKNKRDREILHDRLIDGLRFEELAEKYDLSVRQTKNVVYKGEEVLLKHLSFLSGSR